MKEYVYLLNSNPLTVFTVTANESKIEYPYYDEENDIVWYPIKCDDNIIKFKFEVFEA